MLLLPALVGAAMGEFVDVSITCTDVVFESTYGDCASYTTTNHAYCFDDADKAVPSCFAYQACPIECNAAAESLVTDDCMTIPFDAGYGDCSTYTVTNKAFCLSDMDNQYQTCSASMSCSECTGAPNLYEKINIENCTTIEGQFDAGFGTCNTYRSSPNRAYCSKDIDDFYNCTAKQACKICAPQPKVHTDNCTDIIFNSGYGTCSTYARENKKYCATDMDEIYDCTAAQSCAECAKRTTADCETIEFNAGFGDCESCRRR